jgi:hypothetical protein
MSSQFQPPNPIGLPSAIFPPPQFFSSPLGFPPPPPPLSLQLQIAAAQWTLRLRQLTAILPPPTLLPPLQQSKGFELENQQTAGGIIKPMPVYAAVNAKSAAEALPPLEDMKVDFRRIDSLIVREPLIESQRGNVQKTLGGPVKAWKRRSQGELGVQEFFEYWMGFYSALTIFDVWEKTEKAEVIRCLANNFLGCSAGFCKPDKEVGCREI